MQNIINVKSELVPVNRLIPHPRNVNDGALDVIEASIRANGFFGSLVVQTGTRHILAGNHRFEAARRLGYEAVPVDWVEVDDQTALRILLADNRTARLGHDKPQDLAALLSELAQTDDELLGTGYDSGFLDALIGELASTPDQRNKTGKGADDQKDRAQKEIEPPFPLQADGDVQPVAEEEATRLGVIVICDTAQDQDHLFRKIVEYGWCPQKSKFSEQALTRLQGETD